MTLRYANVASTLDLTAPGKRAGHFSLTHSDDRHGFAAIRAPLGVIRGGSGPVALICGGNGRSNEPYKEGEPPRYTPLAKVSTATTSGTRAAGGWAPGAGQTRCDRSTRDRGARSSRSCLHRRYGRRAGLFTRAFPTRCRRNVELLAPSLECSPA